MHERGQARQSLIELRALRKQYGQEIVTEVLHGIDLEIHAGEFTAIIGPSGSGKSTLLNLIGLLDRPSSGSVLVHGHATEHLPEKALTRLRSRTLGFIFQFHHLVGAFTAKENLMIPLGIQDKKMTVEHRARALQMLDRVGLAEKAQSLPSQLSGGQQQRVAIARALVHRPEVVLADEPTGNLDSQSASKIFSLLRELNEEQKITFLIVTHDPRMARRCDRVVVIEDGLIARDGPSGTVLPPGM